MTTQRLTDMDVKNGIAVEDYESDWVCPSDDKAALEIYATENAHKALSDLSIRVDSVRDQPTLEAYQWSYQTLTGTPGYSDCKQVSLESFTGGVITKKSSLAKVIRSEAAQLHTKLEASIETYARDIKEDVLELAKIYDAAHRKLHATSGDLEETSKSKVQVNHTRIFQMFTVKNQFKGKEPIQAIRTEIQNLERLTQIVGKGVDRITKDVNALTDEDNLERSSRDLPDTQNTMQLMFNRTAKVSQGQFDESEGKKQTPKMTHSWGQHFWIAFGTIMFGNLGHSIATAINHKKKDSEAKVSNSLTDIHKYIRHVEGMDEIVDDLAGHVQDLIGLFKKVNESQESALNRRAVPVIELVTFIMKQIIDITKGTDTLFTRIVRKNSK